jgi:uncharacterized membrane protein YedE/YeeE
MTLHDFTPLPALAGGALIGLSATLLLLTHGKVAGVSGLVGRIPATPLGGPSARPLLRRRPRFGRAPRPAPLARGHR